ncbi:MAG: DUF1553 domain-containing protein [Verrucomicrobiales bacterium]|nr:DUF1553 domain-containing protein [Verrucomicrobiales bacterium]MCP5557554.1 DUF1553 domain-containing protein [Verrucomicrobiaceae bacterium]
MQSLRRLRFALWLSMPAVGLQAQVTFNRDVRPILSDHCFACHGPDEKARKADLRLDIPGGNFDELIARITSHDEEEIMPPPMEQKKLSSAQIATLKTWIAAGAPYQRHWAFELPHAEGGSIDAIVGAQLQARGLSFAAPADRATLIRRVSLDLTGLPPAAEDVAAFVAGHRTFEQVVDRLLSSPHFGEHLAVAWLDAARYADTNGYFGDRPRQMWPWRDWVIDAFNANMPFDQFTIEQLAGDLLPKPTRDQLVATGFCRNSMANDEGGIDDEEYRVEFIVDRLDAISKTWLGLSIGCAQCHDHKFDPISQREFYQIFAFFNNTAEVGHIKSSALQPAISVPSPAQEAEALRLKAQRLAASAEYKKHEPEVQRQLPQWSDTLAKAAAPEVPKGIVFENGLDGKLPASPGFKVREVGTSIQREEGLDGMAAKFDGSQHVEIDGELGLQSDHPWTIAVWMKGEETLSCVLSKVQADEEKRGIEVIWLKGALQINLVHRWAIDAIEVVATEPLERNDWNLVVLSYDGSRKAAGLTLSANGVQLPLKVNRDSLTGSISNGEPLRLGRRDANLGFYGMIDDLRVLDRVVPIPEAAEWFAQRRLHSIALKPPQSRTSREKDLLLEHFIKRAAEPAARVAFAKLRTATAAETAQQRTIPTTLVMLENAKVRPTYLLERGQWNAPGEKVEPGVPAVFPQLQGSRDRLGFARWLVTPDNPLTARVAANRLWQQCFGDGLVRTPNDFGSQGEPPTYPDLLDWLAQRFVRTGWDVKALLRTIVLSRTYQQNSRFNESDPDNRLLARGPAFRLNAEALRDQALAISGLLSTRIGGPSAMPWQPPGVWEAVSYNAEESYTPDFGEGAWRRTLYSYWKRQAPPPAILTFDGPTREKCLIARARTNTPLQALVMLNDENYTAAASALGARAAALPLDDSARVAWMFQQTTARRPQPDEVALLLGLVKRQQQRGGDVWQVVAHTLFNLDEVITKR